MTVPAPQTLPASSAWQLIDVIDRSYTSDAPASGGSTTITLPALDTNTRWELTHMVAGCATTAKPKMRLYLNSVANGNLRDGTNSGAFDVADWPAGLLVPAGAQLIAQWTGCNDGDVATMTLQADVYRLVS